MSALPPFLSNKLLKEFSTFGIGGPARLFVQVQDVLQMQCVLSYCHKENIPFFILGKGSNCLFDDRGFDGLVIQNKITHLAIQGSEVDVGAGYSFSMLGVKTAKAGLTGLEFAAGIPASVGGAIFMNAGASGEETANCLQEVTFVTAEGEVVVWQKKDLPFSYRHSLFQERKGAIACAKFFLQTAQEPRKKQLSIIEYRTKTQPYEDPSAGCAFKNPPGQSAGALIEKSGLKGFCIGGAEVSRKHANFLVNRSEASAKDVLALAEHVRQQVKENTGIQLELEIRCIPYQINR